MPKATLDMAMFTKKAKSKEDHLLLSAILLSIHSQDDLAMQKYVNRNKVRLRELQRRP